MEVLSMIFSENIIRDYTPNIVSIILMMISSIIIFDHVIKSYKLQQCQQQINDTSKSTAATTSQLADCNTCSTCNKKEQNFGDEIFDSCSTPTLQQHLHRSQQYLHPQLHHLKNGANNNSNNYNNNNENNQSPPSNSSSPQPFTSSSSFLSPLNYITGSSKSGLDEEQKEDEEEEEEYDNETEQSKKKDQEQIYTTDSAPTSSIPTNKSNETGEHGNIFGGKDKKEQQQQQQTGQVDSPIKTKKKKKKNQAYTVSTYYSNYEVPKETSFTCEPVDEPDNNNNNNTTPTSISSSASSGNPSKRKVVHYPLTSSSDFEELDISQPLKQQLTTTTPSHSEIELIHPPNPSNMTQTPVYLPDLLSSGGIGIVGGTTSTDSPLSIRSSSSATSTTTNKSITKRKKTCILPQILHLKWKTSIKKVLVIHKFHDIEVLKAAKEVGAYLNELGIGTVCESEQICECPTARSLEEISDPFVIDFIVSLGGDGTILHTSSLFKTYMPPIISFNMGSLGFLTTFEPDNWREHIKNVIDGKCYVSYRLRLACTVVSKNESHTYQVLNEVSIDRGNNPYLSHLECLCDDKPITVVQADGLIIATSTGSTAYSLSAGGSLVHPAIPAMLITPICPHTLSFRPVLLPSTSTLIIRVPETSRCSAWASFDGKNRHEIKQGDYVVISTSKWAVPVICKTDENGEWFEKLANNLNWNTRTIQKSFQSSPPTFSTTSTSLLPSPSPSNLNQQHE